TIGQELLPLLAAQAEGLMETDRLHLRLVGLANTRQMVFDETGLSPDDALERLENEGQPADLDALVQMLVEAKLERLTVVDATASEDVARRYPELLNAGVAVVTPNKTANTLDYDFYQRLLKSARHLRTP